MYCYRNVTKDIYWVGGNDRRLSLFEGVYSVPNGVSYNSYFVNYFETMVQYMPKAEVISKIKDSARMYNDIVNINFADDDLKKAFIQIKMHNGEDTYAYLLNVYNDYIEQSITKATFLEILSTIDEYLSNRLKTPNDVSFNELIKYLNAFITCK